MYRETSNLFLKELKTKFLRADLIEIFKPLRPLKNLDPSKFFNVVGEW